MAQKIIYSGMTNLILTRTKKVTTCMMTHEQITQMFNEDSDDVELFNSRGVYWSKNLVRLVHECGL